jgi:hypothetical protein
MDNGSLSHFPLPAAPAPALFRKSYSFVKGQRYAFVGYYHAVICKNTQHSIQEICTLVGVSKPTLYAYLRDRETVTKS